MVSFWILRPFGPRRATRDASSALGGREGRSSASTRPTHTPTSARGAVVTITNAGWNVAYDFNESDFVISRKLVSLYLTKSYEDNDEFLPWGSLKYLIGDAM